MAELPNPEYTEQLKTRLDADAKLWRQGYEEGSTPLRIEAPEALVVRPGDTLVVRFPTNIDSETFYRADREIGRLIGHRCKYMIVTADQLAVIRGDDHADDA